MSSKKYVLQTDGSIRRTTFNEDGTSDLEIIDSERVTKDQNNKFDTFESLRTDSGLKTSSALMLPLGPLNTYKPSIISEDKNGLLKNKSFNFESDENIQYYNQFNGIFSDFSNENKIYAEELEMLAGFDANSLGLINTDGTIDTLKFLFIFDYILESALYIATAEVVVRLLDNAVGEIIYKYFYDLLNYPKFPMTSKVEPLAYFLIGLNEFVNTDPKIPQLIKNNLIQKSNLNFTKVDLKSPNSFFTQILGILLDSLLALSKLEHNRILLLIRKFQQESHWHKSILYKAKKDSSENFVDKIFVEFSQYYFKFAIERMHIGRMIWRRKVNIEFHKDKRINFSNRLSEERHLSSTNSVPIQTKQNKAEKSDKDKEFPGDYKSKYFWREEDSRNKGDNTLSITALPQLLKTNTYIKKVALQNVKHRQNFDDSDRGKGKKSPQKRLSPEIVKLVEERLDNEYMPFYFHDLRTNEILAFHAFIDTISDSFSPEYASSTGYGRIDDVKHYVKTTRTINTTFNLVSYNQDDHDLMWYQINKLVSMVYPQWSKGIKRNDKDNTAFPFTQMPTASPLIRLRVGDVITSNYSKENLARLHAHGGDIGQQKISTKPNQKKAKADSQENTPRAILDEYVINKNLLDNAYPVFENQMFLNVLGKSNRENTDVTLTRETLPSKSSAITGLSYEDLSGEDKKKYVIPKIGDRLNIEEIKSEKHFVAFVVDVKGKQTSKKFIIEKHLVIKKENEEYVNAAGSSVVDARSGGKINNPFTAAYESSRGEGLAGFITNLDVNYNESTWQTEIKGSRAPMMVKITIGFAPVHDIPPGLDHLGEMRAPIYNVGSINRKMFRTPYDNDIAKTKGT